MTVACLGVHSIQSFTPTPAWGVSVLPPHDPSAHPILKWSSIWEPARLETDVILGFAGPMRWRKRVSSHPSPLARLLYLVRLPLWGATGSGKHDCGLESLVPKGCLVCPYHGLSPSVNSELAGLTPSVLHSEENLGVGSWLESSLPQLF